MAEALKRISPWHGILKSTLALMPHKYSQPLEFVSSFAVGIISYFCRVERE